MKFVSTLFVTVPPTFSSQLPAAKQTKTENETMSYSCAVEAKPAATIQWILNGQNLSYTAPYNISSSVAPISNSKLLKTLAYLTVNRVSWREHGNFSCLAFNNAGKKSQTTELEVRCKCSLIYTKTSTNEKRVESMWMFVLLMWLNLSFSLCSAFYSKHNKIEINRLRTLMKDVTLFGSICVFCWFFVRRSLKKHMTIHSVDT